MGRQISSGPIARKQHNAMTVDSPRNLRKRSPHSTCAEDIPATVGHKLKIASVESRYLSIASVTPKSGNAGGANAVRRVEQWPSV